MNGAIDTINAAAGVWAREMWAVVWQSVVLAGLIAVTIRCIRRTSPALRCWLWMLVPLRLLVMPLVGVTLPVLPLTTQKTTISPVAQTSLPMSPVQEPYADPIEVTERSGDHLPPTPVARSAGAVQQPMRPVLPSVWTWIMAAWVLGAALCLVRLVRNWRRVRRIVLESEDPTDGQILAVARQTADRMSLARTPSIRITRAPVSPFLCGAVRPTVVLPESLILEVSADELSAVLVHEFAHVRRRDLLIGWVLAVCELFYFFHPVFHLAKRRVLFERERACDDWVLAHGQSRPTAYARALIAAADACSTLSQELTPVGVVAESFRDLQKRISVICTNAQPNARLSAASVVCLATVTLASLPSVALTARSPSDSQPERVVRFPADRSIGRLYILDADAKRRVKDFHRSIDGIKWEYLGQATGDVAVPAGKRLFLDLNHVASRDLSSLSELDPGDLYKLNCRSTSRETPILADGSWMRNLSRLTGLKELQLSSVRVKGRAMRHIEKLTSLERLWTGKVKDAGLAHIAKLPQLKALYLTADYCTNAGLRHLERLKYLEEMQLFMTPERNHLARINDDGMVHLTKLDSLTHIWLRGNFTDAGLVHLKEMDSLKMLKVASWIPTDAGLEHIGDIPGLEVLSLSRANKITDQGLAHLKRLPALKKLNLSMTPITDDGIVHLKEIKSLELLVLPEETMISDRGSGSPCYIAES